MSAALRETTSCHGLSADAPLTAPQKLRFLALNTVNNLRLARSPVRALGFAPSQSALELNPRLTPTRNLSNLFWRALPWARIREEFGPANVLDIGCGTGRYASQLRLWSGGAIGRYKGIDVQPSPEWAQYRAADPGLSFGTYDGRSVVSELEADTHLVMSQSTLEHVVDDLDLLRQLRDWTRASRRPLLQVHFVPSPACLWSFLFHGIRQYNLRALAEIAELYRDFSEVAIFRLGGPFSWLAHVGSITLPALFRAGDLRKSRPGLYRAWLERAIRADRPFQRACPAFYALVISSNARRPLWGSSRSKSLKIAA